MIIEGSLYLVIGVFVLFVVSVINRVCRLSRLSHYQIIINSLIVLCSWLLGGVLITLVDEVLAALIGYLLNLSVANHLSWQLPVGGSFYVNLVGVMLVALVVNAVVAECHRSFYFFSSITQLVVSCSVSVLLLSFFTFRPMTIMLIGGTAVGGIISVGPFLVRRLSGYEDGVACCFYGSLVSSLWVGYWAQIDGERGVKEPKSSLKGMILLVIGLLCAVCMLFYLAFLNNYHLSLKLIVFEQFIIDGLLLFILTLVSLVIGMICCWIGLKFFVPLYEEYLAFLRRFLKHDRIAVNWVYLLKNRLSEGYLGGVMSMLMSIITLIYFSFYDVQDVIMPHLLLIGLLGWMMGLLFNSRKNRAQLIVSSGLFGIFLTVCPMLFYGLVKTLPYLV